MSGSVLTTQQASSAIPGPPRARCVLDLDPEQLQAPAFQTSLCRSPTSAAIRNRVRDSPPLQPTSGLGMAASADCRTPEHPGTPRAHLSRVEPHSFRFQRTLHLLSPPLSPDRDAARLFTHIPVPGRAIWRQHPKTRRLALAKVIQAQAQRLRWPYRRRNSNN